MTSGKREFKGESRKKKTRHALHTGSLPQNLHWHAKAPTVTVIGVTTEEKSTCSVCRVYGWQIGLETML